MDKIRIIFILPETCNDESEAPTTMREAYEACVDYVANVQWVKEHDYQSIDLNKTDFLIFNEFKGENFDSLKGTKSARILGPWCVLICLSEGRPIPNFPWPIYNVAMDGCVVSCSHLPKKTKLAIREKVQLMGGCYTETLVSGNTHLITENVCTEKYALAAEAGVSVMLPKWVEVVWEDSLSRNVKANEDTYRHLKCLPFQNLTVCSTGISDAHERQELAEIVVKNGGKFTGKLSLNETDILVCKGTSGTTSEKYKAARKTKNIQCVTPDWIIASADKGYALPCGRFQVEKGTSTPTRGGDKEALVNPDFSSLSVIFAPQLENKSNIEETVNCSTISSANFRRDKISSNFGLVTPTKKRNYALQRNGLLKNEYVHILNGVDIKSAKTAGHYLDGFNVYIAGFESEHREKLCKILNLSGATRYDGLSDRLTHIIIGDTNCPDLKIIKSRGYSCSLVSVRWLVESLKHQKPVEEEDFLIKTSADSFEGESPLSKKGISLLSSNRTVTESDFNADDEMKVPSDLDKENEQGNDIMKQYLQQNTNDEDTLANLLRNADNLKTITNAPLEESRQPKEISTQQSETYTMDEESQPLDIFEGLKFSIVGFTSENFAHLKETIESAGGSVVVNKQYRGVPDFCVTPIFNASDLNLTATEIVNDLYITECSQERESLAINYYHRPFVLQNTTPLRGCVIAISGFCSYERSFLNNLVAELGGESQDRFSRIMCVEKNVKPCTHLISLEPTGKKYLAALKWNLPVLNKDWLVECARIGKYVEENAYLVGDARASRKQPNVSAESSSVMSSSTITKSVEGGVSVSDIPENLPKDTDRSKRKFDLTPTLLKKHPLITGEEKTPVSKLPKSSKQTPETCSQVTPVRKIMEEARANNLLGTPESPPMPRAWHDIATPETPLGAFIRPNPSPNLKKEMARWLNRFPDYVPPKPRRNSTPLSELKRQLMEKFLTGKCPSRAGNCQENDQNEVNRVERPNFEDAENGDSKEDESMDCAPLPEDADETDRNSEENDAETPQKNMVHDKLNLLEQMLSENKGKRRESRSFKCTVPAPANPEIKDSQAFTVGWDYMVDEATSPQQNNPSVKIFMLSGIDETGREQITKSIESLGGVASDLQTYDPSSTHLICAKPARNEKVLACLAAGKWILHLSYIERSREAKKFLNEEEFQFGNPKFKGNIPSDWDKDTEIRTNSIYWWRKEINKQQSGAFKNMKAIVVAGKRDPIIRVIEAGGGTIVNALPPYNEPVDATHCLIEPRSVADFSAFFPLAKQGIYCVNTMYISDHLHRINKDIKDCILPYFAKYYT